MSSRLALEGRHALVTGAGSGIGRAIALRLAQEGARLTLVGRRRDALEAVAAECPASAAPHIAVCDVGDAAQVDAAWAGAVAVHGPIEVLVNNAGSAESAPLHRTDDALWRRMMAVNLDGTFHGCRAALPGMLKAGSGRIVNVASTAGQRGYAYVAAYAAAKHGVVGLTRSLALEVAMRGITVNAVCPGFTETPMLERSTARITETTGRSAADAVAALAAHNPQQRLVQPAEVAEAVAWLCRDEAASVHGQCLSIAGGEVMA